MHAGLATLTTAFGVSVAPQIGIAENERMEVSA